MNKFMNINRIEFSITNVCTSRCKHCSVGSNFNSDKANISRTKAVSVINELSNTYSIESVMTFGGEPLLYSDTVFAIHNAAKECGVLKRQIITNGYFTKEKAKVLETAKKLVECGINSILLSVDVFHKEYIPLDKVYLFAKTLSNEKVEGLYLHPAWVVNREDNNHYNRETEECLKYFEDLNIKVSNGNNIFLSGSAIENLSEYYKKEPVDISVKCGELPYTTKLDNIETIAINPNGDACVCNFVIGNINENSINEIVENYNPYNNKMISIILNGGISDLLVFAKENKVEIDFDKHYSTCSICRELVQILN